jgi:MoxR-like ATPase
LDDYAGKLEEFDAVLREVVDVMQPHYNMCLFQVHCKDFKEAAEKHTHSLIFNLMVHMKDIAVAELGRCRVEFDRINAEFDKIPQTPEELAKTRQYITMITATADDRQKKLEHAVERFTFLEGYKFAISDEEIKLQYEALRMPRLLESHLDKTTAILAKEQARMMVELGANEKNLEQSIRELAAEIPTFVAKYQDLESTYDATQAVEEMQRTMMDLRKQQDLYNSHQQLFGAQPHTSKPLAKFAEDFLPLYSLWTLSNDWHIMTTTWLDSQFSQLKPDAVNTFMLQSMKKIARLKKDLQPYPELAEKVLVPLTEAVDKFKTHVPLISKLRHPGIKTKHWEKISGIVGFKVVPNDDLTLQNFLNLELERWNEPISEIANVAAQEYNIESSLDAMEAELQTQLLQTSEFRDTQQFILAGVDDIMSIIDDQLVTTQTLLTSPYIAPVKKRATERLAFLRHCHETLDAWVECQRGWLYLQPIFTGTSIQQKLHKEAHDWNTVDKMWTAILGLTHQHPDFVGVMHRDHLHEDLVYANKLLESITQGLNAYLEAKRLGFPRFFFLSNDELISILSHTRDFNHINKSMNKLFEYIATMTFDEDSMITAMNDDGLEKVEFLTPVDGKTEEIEDWLSAFEEEMKTTLKESIRDCIPASQKKKREAWITDFPAQIILITNQIIWTQQVTSALRTPKSRGLVALQTRFIEQLEQLTAQIRQPLSLATRQVISCLLINEVHNRDIIANLIQQEVSDADAFKWQIQLRYYWDDDTVLVKSINNVYEYSYEYAGNSARLVITPLTDRCYQTLLSAFKQNMSGAPSGPAGTGKTETARDCAKALGRSCVVYNCSEEVTPEQMSQFFAGLSSSGSWSCFDEFNRINIEVLSVIAQQVRSIQEAIAANADSFVLDQRTLKLNANAAIIITMNPGYAGRTELPDNLKALFRPCAMMVPDFGFIAEIMLFSGGFASASALSVKLVALFDLCRKQLSHAHHYDWGLRAMKAILSTSGKAKRSHLEEREALLLVRSIVDCTRPRLVSVDVPLFDGIVNDVFPDISASKVLDDALTEQLASAFTALGCQALPLYLSKCNEMRETCFVRHGLMFVGGAMGGKSTCWKALAAALNSLPGDPGVEVRTLNPKAISIPELYGLFDPVTSGWSDGVLSSHIRDCSLTEQNIGRWIVVDGPVDSLWIETMNSLLDDNKVLCLSNNERISLGGRVRMMFEVDDLSQASPATVSRCGMIYFDPSSLPASALLDSWFARNTAEKWQPLFTSLRALADAYLPKLVQFVEVDAEPALGGNANFLITNCLTLLQCFLDLLRDPVERPPQDGEDAKLIDPLPHALFCSPFAASRQQAFGYVQAETQERIFGHIFAFCAVWAFAGVLPAKDRALFDHFFRELVDKLGGPQFPSTGTVFDYFFDLSKSEWAQWCDGDTGIELTSHKPIEQVLVPTAETGAVLFLVRMCAQHPKHLLLHGPESFKTLVVNTLMEDVLESSFECRAFPLANCSTAANVLKVLRSFLHRRQGAFGPLVNHELIVFLDNLGSVKPEVYGAQPPLELLRQFFDYGGWYDTSCVEFQRIVGTTLLAAMAPAGSGLFDIPERLLRHFCYLHVPKLQEPSMQRILKLLLSERLERHVDAARALIPAMAKASIAVYEQCSKHLLPVPSKMHYIFSLRNLVRVLKGILLVDAANIADNNQFIRLWYHEMMREFHDRFNAPGDRDWFVRGLNSVLAAVFRTAFEMIAPDLTIAFNDFADRSGNYRECAMLPEETMKCCQHALEDYNRESAKSLDIVLFEEAIDHLGALSRVLSMRRGHALLVGVKSSGRKSLA